MSERPYIQEGGGSHCEDQERELAIAARHAVLQAEEITHLQRQAEEDRAAIRAFYDKAMGLMQVGEYEYQTWLRDHAAAIDRAHGSQ